jgi:hypothetical protein
VAGELRGRRGLLIDTRQFSIDAGPARCTRCPNGHCRPRTIRIVKASNPNEYQMWSRLCLAEQRSTAGRAKSPMHAVATVRGAREVSRPPRNLERRAAKASSNRPATCPQVLAIAAPAGARSDRRFLALPTNRPAKAPASQCHCTLPGVKKVVTANRTLRGQLLVGVPPNPFIPHRRATAGRASLRARVNSNVRPHNNHRRRLCKSSSHSQASSAPWLSVS